MREYRISIKVGGEIHHLEKEFGFMLLESDNSVLGGDLRAYEQIKYPEKDGVKVYPVTTKEAVDYKIVFCLQDKNNTAMSIIRRFENMLLKGNQAQEIEVYNVSKDFSFRGYHAGIVISEFHPMNREDIIVFEWHILNYKGVTGEIPPPYRGRLT